MLIWGRPSPGAVPTMQQQPSARALSNISCISPFMSIKCSPMSRLPASPWAVALRKE